MAERPKVAPLRFTAAKARQRINALAERSSNLIWTNHVRDQMLSRGITTTDVLRVLRTGYVDEDPTETERGEWKCKITKSIRGGRDVGVVTVIWQAARLILITAEWEDPK
jgi:hypothetical protein